MLKLWLDVCPLKTPIGVCDMAFKIAKRAEIETFRALENLRLVNEKQAAGADIIRLEAGQPCFGAPQPVLEYAREKLLEDPRQGYTDAMGMLALRERIAAYYDKTYDYKDLDPARIAVTVGSSSAFTLGFTAAFDEGDRIGVTTPTYAAYKNILKSLGLQTVEIETNTDTNYQPTVDILEPFADQLDGLIIASPSNPTGTIIDADILKDVCLWAEQKGIRIISDEAYHGITYEESAATALEFTETSIVTNTFSKYFAMTGWRLGWAVLPEDLVVPVKKLAENMFVAPPTLAQHAAWKIFDHTDVCSSYVDKYKANRDILRTLLPEAGIDKLSSSDGAFYIYADIGHLTDNSEDFTRRMLDEAGVSVTSGADFDTNRGHSTIRISYAGSADDMHEAGRRLKKWLKQD